MRSGALPTIPVHTWGSTARERADGFPCDGHIARPDRACFRAVDIEAPSALVYRWICQLRVAPYSYDLIDNLGRRSPDALTQGLGDPVPGQTMMTIFRVAEVTPGWEITLVMRPPGGRTARLARLVWAPTAVTYRVADRGGGRSRLVVKIVARTPRSPLGALMRRVLPVGDLVMMRRQLLNLRRLAERDARRNPTEVPA